MKMIKLQRFYDCLCIFFSILIPIFIGWGIQISLETSYIPTAINGVASCVGLIVGFTATIVTFTISRPEPSENRWRFGLTILFLAIPTIFLYDAYLHLMINEHKLGLKLAMIGLAISIFILLDFLAFLYAKLETWMKQDDKK